MSKIKAVVFIIPLFVFPFPALAQASDACDFKKGKIPVKLKKWAAKYEKNNPPTSEYQKEAEISKKQFELFFITLGELYEKIKARPTEMREEI